MAQVLKVLGQLAPAATTLSALYTVPALTSTVVSTVVVTNTSGSSDTFRISIAVNGAADNVKQYIYYNTPMPTANTFEATFGITLGAGDVVRCYSSGGNCSFNLFGAENT